MPSLNGTNTVLKRCVQLFRPCCHVFMNNFLYSGLNFGVLSYNLVHFFAQVQTFVNFPFPNFLLATCVFPSCWHNGAERLGFSFNYRTFLPIWTENRRSCSTFGYDFIYFTTIVFTNVDGDFIFHYVLSTKHNLKVATAPITAYDDFLWLHLPMTIFTGMVIWFYNFYYYCFLSLPCSDQMVFGESYWE